ncbi:helix-turn-helix domain-containing protein [Actinomadura sp. WMMB 499]|uniref:helix-turn-helix domain-containing protein n=1 Tax=Actinomadura sp. WMMB 499 TaxID=1219491 RepID=UPI001C3FBE0C|nr:helix-turn-helix domain-containing protein [Actinomadura sp. WMMB 499]
MSKARLVITAVVIEGRSQAEVARAYGVSKGWVSKLVARYRAEGEAAFEPRSRRPKTSPSATAPETVELIVRLRKELSEQGLDAGPDTIAWHLAHHHHITVSRATIARHLTTRGLATPQPGKRPRSSCIRFQAELPNQTWQADFTHYRLADGTDTEILTWLDDCRYALHVTAWPRVTGPIVRDTFRRAVAAHGVPPPHSPTTAWCSPPARPAAAAAATPSKPNCAACTSGRRTRAPATPPPAARSNASSRP